MKPTAALPPYLNRRLTLMLGLVCLAMGWALFGPASVTAQPAVGPAGLIDIVGDGSISQRVVVAINESMTEALLIGILERLYTLFQAFIAACCLLAIIFSGWRVVTGEMHEPKSEIAMTVLKVGLVAYFSRELAVGGADGLMPTLIKIPEDLVTLVSENLSDSLFVQGCEIPLYNGDNSYRVWRDLDCLLVHFFAFSAIGSGISALLGFLVSNTVSGYVGIHITVLGIAALSGMIFTILRASYIYVSSMISVVFMLSFAPLFIPAILFQATRQYFDKWLGLCIGYILQPMLVTAYLVIMLSIYAKVLFTNETSVAAALTGSPVTNVSEFDSFFDTMKGVIDDQLVFSGGQTVLPQNVQGVTDAGNPSDLTGYIASGFGDDALTYCDPEAGSDRSERCQDPFGGLVSAWMSTTADAIDYCEYLKRLGTMTEKCGTEAANTVITDHMREIVMSLTIFMLVVFANFNLLQLLEQIVKKLSAISARVSIPFTMAFESGFNLALFGADYYAFAGQASGSSFLGAASAQSSWAPGLASGPAGSLPAYRAGLDAAMRSTNLPFGVGDAAANWINKAEMGNLDQQIKDAIASQDRAKVEAALTAVNDILSRSPTNRDALLAQQQLKTMLGLQ